MVDNGKQFGEAVNRLIAGENLTGEETRGFFTQILNDDQTEMQQGAFLAAITAKGPSPDEIAGTWRAIFDVDTARVRPEVSGPVVDNCGTGMDGFKTFNISTGAAIVAAAGGVCLARHGARAITSKCGTVDLCEALGVDVECPADTVRRSIESAGIGLFNGMSAEIHPKALFRILSRMQFGSILNIAASLANPANPTFGVRGVYAPEMVLPVAETMRAIGYRRAMIFHGQSGNGVGGIDELSPVSDSVVAELTEKGEIHTYTLHPRSVGLNGSIRLGDIAGSGDLREEALRMLRILTGRDKASRYHTVCLNAAPIFMVAGLAEDLAAGMETAREMIDSGRALDKLRQWVSTQNRDPQNGTHQLESLLAEL